MKKNLVLGAIRSYNYAQLEPFVSSLLKTDFNGDLYFLTNDIDIATKRCFEKNNVNWVDIQYRGKGALNSWSRFWPKVKPVVNILPDVLYRFILKNILPLQTVRFLHYKDFLIQNAHKYSHVLLTDVRDVFFQDDPFKALNSDKVQCYEEYTVIGKELLHNVPWIKSLYGDGAIKPFADKKILCSGTIIGPVSQMITFIDQFESVIKKAIDVSAGGSDQGIFNYLIRTQLFDHVEVKKYGEGQILTVSSLDEKSYCFKDHYLVRNDTMYPVIHQYDRLDNIMENFKILLEH